MTTTFTTLTNALNKLHTERLYDMSTVSYPTITLSTDNPEIQDCTLFPALVGLLADFTMKDGTDFMSADVMGYEHGAFILAIGNGTDSYTVIAPVEAISNITYI